ncbi:excisionase and transcriptional regulator [Gordonia phage OneUp]|uniref:HTH DNA binding protein n=1 Tax=Gordonia phage OneUp TaxID=1838074 RepID=A0A160DER8_9CAUD|nr:excisionase and transcriptional regulator [Gordonia phage OneUp]ANA86420.1 HTH DNA binding protein [Gordonia phage OneUp]
MTEPFQNKLAFNKRELAEAVGVHESTIDREIKAGKLEARYVRGKVVILREEAMAWLAATPDEKEL